MKYCPQCNQRFDDSQRFCLNDGSLLSLPDPYRLVGTTQAGKYRIDALIGVGGMGGVYAAHHLSLDRHIAFKIMLPHLALQNPEVARLFEEEAKTAGRLHHENIVTIYDAGNTDDIAYIAMEWLDGRTLHDVIREQGKLSYEYTLELLRQIADALDESHASRTIHRDLKPQNIMLVRRRDGREQIKVLDFGIGKVLSATAGSLVSRIVGTPHYASPEQLKNGAHIDSRSDIYSLGIILFQMLTGQLPFNGKTIEELMRQQLSEAPPLLGSLRNDVPGNLELLIDQLLKKNPDDRPRNVSEIPALFAQACQQPVPVLVQPVQGKKQKKQRAVVTEPTIIRPPASQLVGPDGLSLKTFEFETVTVNDTGEVIERREEVMQGFIEDLGGGVMLEMVRIPAGTFLMGSPPDEKERHDSEGPQHLVTVPEFFMGRYAVTRMQWQCVAELSKIQTDLNRYPSYFKDSWQQPVENINWHDAVEFCARLSRKTGRAYRLPSEAEWEYACRAGTTTPFAFGKTITPDIVNYDGNSPYGNAKKGEYRQTIVLVGSLGVANAFGLYDMHGNVWEWCEDVWQDNYKGAPIDGSAWTSGNQNYRVLRGGSWDVVGRNCRSADRVNDAPGERDSDLGFRVVVSARTQ